MEEFFKGNRNDVKEKTNKRVTNMKSLKFYVLIVICSGLIIGCAGNKKLPDKEGLISNYQYQPLNPTTIWFGELSKKEKKKGMKEPNWQSLEFKKALLRDLDTETVRISLDTLNVSSGLKAGVVGTSVEGQDYVLIIDYIKYNSSSRKVDISYTTNKNGSEIKKNFKGHIPLYSGIGLRIRAEFSAHKSDLNISGLPAISVAASSGAISGRLTVSTLGITGPDISPLMPIISDISVTSIQNAVQAVAAIKAKIYEDDTVVAPKIIGYESPVSNSELIQKITGYLYGLNLVIYPVVSKNPENPSEQLHWINWKLDSWEDLKI